MAKVRKVIIPAAGLGTRFLPATKAMPKEMLPIVDKPTIQYIVEEAIASGIEDIIIVTGKGKRAIEDHFDNAFELEANLMKKKKFELLEKVLESAAVDIHYIRQKEPLGLGHAIWCARKFIGDEPFGVMLGDDVVKSEIPVLKQLIDQFDKVGSSIIGVQEVAARHIHKYGVIDPALMESELIQVKRLVEKPAMEEAPSNLAIIGRYVLTPEIFTYLEEKTVGKNGEIQLTDALERLNMTQNIFAYPFKGRRYDVGEQLGFIETTLAFALDRPELRDGVINLMQTFLYDGPEALQR
ncbi:UTP--glucose-1-phosphate uridylyltransferase GalU [Sporosarcina sp. 179-K 3D1 HS]|uniref:UTP--glucose-1-phosphate uridylyltransferase GalU n=1 Tax=Sporosarcina sp. 179-K 3D1 HS TaxID=3232169 RepID=UPI0039A2E7FE